MGSEWFWKLEGHGVLQEPGEVVVLGLKTETAPGNLQGKSVRIKTLTLLIPAVLLLELPQPNTAVDPTGQSPRKEEE